MSAQRKIKGIWKREAIAGVTTFFTMAYIVIVNPSILASPGTGMSFSGVMTATVLLSFAMTLLMGLYAKLPFAVAPGMGINAFFAYSVILGGHTPWPQALGIIFWAGVLFLITSITPVRVAIARAIPLSLRNAAAVGIGLFLTFIGLKNAGWVVADPATFVRMGSMSETTLLSLLGLLITALLLRRKNPLAFLSGIFLVTFFAWMFGLVHLPQKVLSLPDFHSVFLKLDIWGAWRFALIPTMIAIFFTDLFDSISTFMGVSQAAGLLDEKGEPKNLSEGLLVDALATLGAGLVGTSSGTAFIESSAGIEAGGRTGLTSVVTAICFLPLLFLSPLASIVPAYATAPVLILVGFAMFRCAKELRLEKIEDAIPSFLTIVLIPLTFSITQGILWGFISHCVFYLLVGRGRELKPMMIGVGTASVILVVLENCFK